VESINFQTITTPTPYLVSQHKTINTLGKTTASQHETMTAEHETMAV